MALSRPVARVGDGVAALRGAVGFLTRVPVGRDDRAWVAFKTAPATFPVAGYLVGALVAVPFALVALTSAVAFAAVPSSFALPAPSVAFAYVVAVYAVTGINHVDGVADLGDAAVVHGDADRRREAMKDTTVGVGAVLAVALVLAGLALGALALADLALAGVTPATAVAIVVASEVGAKAGMALVACVGTATHEGLGSSLTESADLRSFALPAVVAVPVVALSWPSPVAAAALAGALAAAVAVVSWARTALGGVSGDVFGAVNELGRVAGLHAGVLAWTLS